MGMHLPPEGSPFSPGLPVSAEYFVGRQDEINLLLQQVGQAVAGRFSVAFITGERGIGKSSLAAMVRQIAEQEFQIAAAHAYMGGAHSATDLVKRLLEQLVKDNYSRPWYEAIQRSFGNHIRQVGLWGVSVELAAPQQDMEAMARTFPATLQALAGKLQPERRGLLLIVDDLNGLAAQPDFAHWIKSVVDEIGTTFAGKLPVALWLVGLEERRQQLITSQPSVARIFHLVTLAPWDSAECRSFYKGAFRRGGVTLEEGALDLLVDFTGGLPVLAHEIGDACWRHVTEGVLTGDAAFKGVTEAAEIIGRKFLDPQVFDAIRSPRYLSILRKIADSNLSLNSFQRQSMLALLTEEEGKVLDNFLRKMRDLGVIISDAESGRGVYRFSNRLFAVYFMIEARRAQKAWPGHS
ncbi:MAG: hypothetical protein GEEBNDBF_01066 [bacterium]|nr:hypothetical protein [bacterium]